MSAGRDVLRVLLGEGITVTKRADGSLGLVPSERVTPELLDLARAAKPQITAIVAGLPAPNACEVCGEPTGWHDGKTQAKCVGCATVVTERLLAEMGIRPPFRRHDIAQEVSAA